VDDPDVPGAVHVTDAPDADDNDPLVQVQLYVRESPSGSLAEQLSVALVPASTLDGALSASITGFWLAL